MKNFNTKKLVRAAVICALYVVLTLVAAPIAFGPIQLRLSEGLTLLPLLYFESIPALFLGCLLSNILSAYGILDVTIGSAATLISAVCTFIIGKFVKNRAAKYIVGGIFPVIINAILIPVVILLTTVDAGYFMNFATIFATQAIFVYAIGVPFTLAIEKRKATSSFLN